MVWPRSCSLSAHVEVGRTALDLGAEEQVKEDVAVVHAPDRAIGVHLYAQSGRAFETKGKVSGRLILSIHGIIPGFGFKQRRDDAESTLRSRHKTHAR
ncbi:MAG: hypothetical protein V2A69_14880 [Pseudomonadota bacterium]